MTILLTWHRELDEAQADCIDKGLAQTNAALIKGGFRRASIKGKTVRQLEGPKINIIIDPLKYSPHHVLGIGHNYYK